MSAIRTASHVLFAAILLEGAQLGFEVQPDFPLRPSLAGELQHRSPGAGAPR